MFQRKDDEQTSKDPARGRRGRLQEKRSKYDSSVASTCFRSRPVPESREQPPPAITPAPRDSKIEEKPRDSKVEEKPRDSKVEEKPQEEEPLAKKVVVKPDDTGLHRNCKNCNGYGQCSCKRRLNNTVVVPYSENRGARCNKQTVVAKEERAVEQYIRMDPPPRQTQCHNSEPNSLPHPPLRFFRPNAIPQLQRYYWDIGDTTDLEFKFAERCHTVSPAAVGGFKVWRYWCQTFSMECTVGDLVVFIEHNIDVPFSEYRLVSYCRGKDDEILPTDWYKTLRCLLLYPKATIVIVPRQPSCAVLRLWTYRILLIVLFPILFLLMIIRCSIAYLIHAWDYVKTLT